MSTHICLDCEFKSDYEAICAHVRAEHNREPLSGPTVAVGDILLRKEGGRVRVLEVMSDGKMIVQPLPLPPLSLNIEYRIAGKRWEHVSGQS